MMDSDGSRNADRFAVIDVGSNSVKLSIAARSSGPGLTLIDTARIVSQLGHGADENGRLKPSAIERTAEAIAEVAAEASSQGATQVRAIATSAAREAPNSDVLQARVEELANLKLEIISGEREAELVFKAVSSHHIADDRRSIIFDSGGGSTEIILAKDDVIEAQWSIPLGALRLKDEFEAGERVSGKILASMRAHARDLLTAAGVDGGDAEIAIGTGGTCSAMALLDIGPLPVVRSSKPPAILRENHTMSLATIEEMVTWLRKMELDERREQTGLRTRRAEIIVAGTCIVAELLDFFGMEWVAMLDVGLRDGMLLEMLHQA